MEDVRNMTVLPLPSQSHQAHLDLRPQFRFRSQQCKHFRINARTAIRLNFKNVFVESEFFFGEVIWGHALWKHVTDAELQRKKAFFLSSFLNEHLLGGLSQCETCIERTWLRDAVFSSSLEDRLDTSEKKAW